MKTIIILFIAVFAFDQGACLKPSRVGQFSPSSSTEVVPNGLVFLLNTTAVYIKSFQSRSVAGQFCVGVVEGNNVLLQESSFDANYSESDIELSLPSTISVASLSWVGVCANGSNNTVLASAIISPQLVTNVPCNTTLIGELPAGSSNITGRVYLLDRETFAVIGFSINMITDAVFWLGSGGTPSVSGMLAPYSDNIMTKLPVVNDQDILVRVPRAAVGTAITYFAIWCRAQNEALSFISVDAGLIPTTPPPPTAAPRVSLGSFRTRQHNVQGNVYALDERTLMLENFFYDGSAPEGFFWAVRGSSVRSNNYWLVPDEAGSTAPLGSYTDRTLVLTLPDGITVDTIDWFAVWCRRFSINFGELRIPDNLQLGVTAPTLPPILPCPPIRSSITMNCKQLAPDMTVSWIINRPSNSITITLCGCIQNSDYMAFGISGDPNGVRMMGGDVTWAWMDSTGVNARDLYLSAYSQCQFTSTGFTGACPDRQNDVTSVTGFREGCTTCIKYQRPLSTNDSQDSSYSLDMAQSIIWAMGPVGNIRTPTQDTIPVPFRHYVNADPSGGAIRINFNRTSRDECNLQCMSCEARVTPWRQPVLSLEETTIHAQIGQSGGQRGYAGITGQSGWGIAWYLNGLLIPNITVIRGRTYRFIVEGGNDPSQPARYHPFYITSSERGGFLATGQESDETIYAGFDGNRPIGVGRYCEYRNKEQDRSNEFSNFTSYRTSLQLTCEDGPLGEFTWTPDSNTPDIVYYQCATHQFLGYQIRVSAAARSSGAIGLFILTIIGLLCAAL